MTDTTMTWEQAIAFRLPNGKTLGELSPDEWAEAEDAFEQEIIGAENMDPLTMTAEDRQRLQAKRDRMRAFSEAVSVIKAELSKRPSQRFLETLLCRICRKEVDEDDMPLKAILTDADDCMALLVLCRDCVEAEGLNEGPRTYDQLNAIFNRPPREN